MQEPAAPTRTAPHGRATGSNAAAPGRARPAEGAGVRSNLAFLIAALRHRSFISGEIDTGFIERHKDELIPAAGIPDDPLMLAALCLLNERRARARSGSPWDVLDGWRVGGAQSE